MDHHADQKLFRLLQARYATVQTALAGKKYERAIDRYLDVCSIALEIEHPIDETFYDAPQFHFYRGPFMQALLHDCVTLEGMIQKGQCNKMLLGFADNIPQNGDAGHMEQEEARYFLDGVILKGDKNAAQIFRTHRKLIEHMTGYRTFEKYVLIRGIPVNKRNV